MDKIALIVAVLALAVSGALFFVGGNESATLGGVTNYDALTLSTGPLVVTTSNTATSTIIVGCYQSYATSTATALKLTFTASTTAPTNGSGVIPLVSYGTCP